MAIARETLCFDKVGDLTLLGDLYMPQTERPPPVVIGVPGGAWIRGSRADLAHWGHRIAEAGIATFAIDYRRATEGPVFPQNVIDVLSAIRFIRTDGARLGVDPGRIALLGVSAGAHLAALAALSGGRWQRGTGDAGLGDVQAFVGVYGVYDLAEHWRACRRSEGPLDDAAERMMGSGLMNNEEAYLAASPARHVWKPPRIPAALIIWGDHDHTVLPVQSTAFADLLEGAGADIRRLSVPGAGHFWFSKEADTRSGYCAVAAPHILAFLTEKLGVA